MIHTVAGLPAEADTPELLVTQAAAAVGASGGVLGIVRERSWIDVVTSRGHTGSRIAAFNPMKAGPASPLTDAVFTAEPVWLSTGTDVATRYPLFATRTRAQAVAALPLLLGGEAIGVLAVCFDEGMHDFTRLEQKFLRTLADVCALVLHRWQSGSPARDAAVDSHPDRLPGEVDARLRRASGLAALGRQLSAAVTTAQVSAIAADYITPALDATAAFVGIINDRAQTLVIETRSVTDPGIAIAYARRPLSDSLPMTDAARTGRTVYLSGTADRQRRYPHTAADAAVLGVTACAATPIRDSNGQILGSLWVSWPSDVDFDSAMSTQLASVADLCGLTMERARLFDDGDVLVSALQQRVLRPLPVVSTLDSHAICRPALGARMGGDFYAGVRLNKHRLAVAIGDVANHGMVAAAEMSELHTLTCALMAEDLPLEDLAEHIERMRDTISDGSATFTTMILAVADTDQGSLSYLHIGHPPMLLRRDDRTVLHLIDGRRPLLGLGGRATVGTIPFSRGDTLVAYTDGLVEQRTRPADIGILALSNALRTADGDAERIAETLLQSCGPARLTTDDQSIIVIVHR